MSASGPSGPLVFKFVSQLILFLKPFCIFWNKYDMGLDARKHLFGVCEKQRCRPACASVQTDQRLRYSLFESISKNATSEIQIFLLASVPEENGLSLALWETPNTSFVASRLILLYRWSHQVPNGPRCDKTCLLGF